MQVDAIRNRYLVALGKVIANLHSLEAMLRIFLAHVETRRYERTGTSVDLDRLSAGDYVAEDYFTNYDTLGKLIGTYNSLAPSPLPERLRVDETIVDIRDALAHGRVLGQGPSPPMTLYKFSKPRSGRVKVADVIDLTEATLDQMRGKAVDGLYRVHAACSLLCPEILG